MEKTRTQSKVVNTVRRYAQETRDPKRKIQKLIWQRWMKHIHQSGWVEKIRVGQAGEASQAKAQRQKCGPLKELQMLCD